MKKRILSALLALCMVFALGTVGAMAEGPVEEPGTTGRTLYVNQDVDEDPTNNLYKTFSDALNASRAGDTIELQSNLKPYMDEGTANIGIYNISHDLTIKGNGKTVYATNNGQNSGSATGVHVFNVTAGKVTIEEHND